MPAPQQPIRVFFNPNKRDQGLIELWNTNVSAYAPLDLGTTHPNTREFPDFKLGRQQNAPNDENWVFRFWVTDESNPDWWNWSEKYLSESKAHPIFIRQYREDRKNYVAATKGEPLMTVWRIQLEEPGSGYTPGTLPAVTFNNAGHQGVSPGPSAIAHAVVKPDGTIGGIVLDYGGIGYVSAPTATISDPPSGETATCTVEIQPPSCVLVAEQAERFPTDSEFYGLYLNVTRVYQTLPGPEIEGQDYNRQFSFPIPYIQQITAAGERIGDDLTEVTPIDSAQQQTKTVDIAAFQEMADNYILLFSDVSDIPLPDILSSIASIKNESYGEGGGDVSGFAETVGTHGSFALSIPMSNQSSAALSYELNFKIIDGKERGRNKSTKRGVVLMPEGFTDAELVAHIALLAGLTVSAWPNFQPQTESFIVKGMSVAVQTEAQTSTHYSFDSTSQSDGKTFGTTFSYRSGVQSGPVRVSPTIHGALSISGDGTSASRAVTSASRSAQTGTLPVDSGTVSKTATAVAGVSPTSLSATPGQSTYPTSGYRLVSQNAEPLMYRYIIVHFEMFDFGLL